MRRESKLTEKGTRVPDVRQPKLEDGIPRYLREVESLSSESARSHRFTALLQELLGVQPGFIEEYTQGIEKYVRTPRTDQLLRRRADNLFGNVVIEFERSIPKNQSQAEAQLRNYVAILWTQERPDARTPYLCIATDGARFLTYSPSAADPSQTELRPDDVELLPVERADWNALQPCEVFYWLDRHFLRKEQQHPTTERIVADFGMRSHAFHTTAHSLLTVWQEVKAESDYAVVYESWDKYLRIVYGSDVGGEELFIRHTYLATLAKIMSWVRLSGSVSLPDDAEIVEMLEGRLFKAQGIENFIEEDFFSWIGRPRAARIGVAAVRWLLSLVQSYNLSELSEDVLKSLYQELVDPQTRHDLGEFYTPDWLAHRIVRRLLDRSPRGSMLDPACGSGTFLYLAIREKRQRLGNRAGTLAHILDSVYGVDVHPLAVIVAKTNYILALGDLLKRRKGVIRIPVYLADTMKLPERFMESPDYQIRLDSQIVHVHGDLLSDTEMFDRAVELAKEFALQHKGERIAQSAFEQFLAAQGFEAAAPDLVESLFRVVQVLKHFVDKDRDTIWAYVLKNIYKPLFFRRKFDFVMGNPPWIAFRYMEPDYQSFLKEQIASRYRLLVGRGELVTHMEIATLFLVRAADLYLRPGGSVAFVLPRSLFTADQHDALRRRSFRLAEHSVYNLYWREIWDCMGVSPLFNVPACVVIADKEVIGPMTYPVAGEVIAGRFTQEGRNASLEQAEHRLTALPVRIALHMRGRRSYWAPGDTTTTGAASTYETRFGQGATIVPRAFWFVQVNPSPVGINPDLPLVETSVRAKDEAKEAYRGVVLKGTVESRFLYATLLSTDLLPFGHFPYRLTVLPIEEAGAGYRLVDADEARRRGFLHLGRWLDAVKDHWTERRSAKAERLTALEWLDYRKKLTSQNPGSTRWVVYNASGTNLAASTVEAEAITFPVNGQTVKARGFVADYKVYYWAVTGSEEAHFLTAVLNSRTVDALTKPMQTQGLWGPRDICKKVLELPIPEFDPNDDAHVRLADLGRRCARKTARWIGANTTTNPVNIGRARSEVRRLLAKELADIDELVKPMLELGSGEA